MTFGIGSYPIRTQQGAVQKGQQLQTNTSISPEDLLALEDALYSGATQPSSKVGKLTGSDANTKNLSAASQRQVAGALLLLQNITSGDSDAVGALVQQMQNMTPPEAAALLQMLGMLSPQQTNTPSKPAPESAATPTSSSQAASSSSQSGGLSPASQKALQAAEDLFNKNQYQQAYEAYSAALKKDPSIAQQWPDIYYQLGASAEYSNDPTLIQQAKSNYETYVKTPGADPKTVAWVQNELKTGLPAQILIQSAGTLYQANHYDAAYEKYAAALQVDPSLAKSWPTIFYQLGTCADFAKSPALNEKAIGYYNQYLASPKPNPQQVKWVKSEVAWLGEKGPAQAALNEANHQFYDMQNSGTAFDDIQKAIQQYPELASHQPDVLYTAANFAYSDANTGAAQHYLTLAEAAMAKQQASGYKSYWEQQIKGLQQQINDPWGNLPTVMASWLGDKMGGRGFWQQLLQGAFNGWFTPEGGRLYSHNDTMWESKQYASSRTKNFKTGQTDSVSQSFASAEQKKEFDELNGKITNYERLLNENSAESNKLNEKLTGDIKPDEKEKLEAEQEKLSANKDQLAASLAAAKKARDNLIKTNTDDPKRKTSRELSRTEHIAIHDFDKHIRDQQQQIAEQTQKAAEQKKKLKEQNEKMEELKEKEDELGSAQPADQKTLDETKAEIANIQIEINKTQTAINESKVRNESAGLQVKSYKQQRENLLAAMKEGPEQGALYTAQVWQATLQNETEARTVLQGELEAVRNKANKTPADNKQIASLKEQIKAADKRVDAAKERAAATLKLVDPAVRSAAAKEMAAVAQLRSIAQQHDALVDKLTAAGKDISSDPQIQALVTQMETAAEAGQAAQNDYIQAVAAANHPTATRKMRYEFKRGVDGKYKMEKVGFAPDNSVKEEEGRVKSNPYEGGEGYGPGWWGVGTTLDHQQAAALQWSLGQDQNGNTVLNQRTGFTSLNNADPTQQGVTLEQGGKGVNSYQVQGNFGVNVANAEHRDYEMMFTGSTGAGAGFGGMVGDQSRADLVDAAAGVNTYGGKADIGGEHIASLASSSLTAQGAVGAQTDGDASFGVGTQGAAIGAGGRAFVGAQASGMASGTVDGVGGGVMGQAWAGLGAAAHANASYQNGVLNLSLGVGAGLGVGGYVDENLQINFGQILQEFKGINNESMSLASNWESKVPVLGGIAGFVSGDIEGTGELIKDTAESAAVVGLHTVTGAAELQQNIQSLLNKKMGGIGGTLLFSTTPEGLAIQLGSDVVNAASNQGVSTAKAWASKTGVAGDVGGFVAGTTQGTANSVTNTVKSAVSGVANTVKNFFSGW